MLTRHGIIRIVVYYRLSFLGKIISGSSFKNDMIICVHAWQASLFVFRILFKLEGSYVENNVSFIVFFMKSSYLLNGLYLYKNKIFIYDKIIGIPF